VFFERLTSEYADCESAPTFSVAFSGYSVLAAIRWRMSKRLKNRKNLIQQKCENLADCPSGVFV